MYPRLLTVLACFLAALCLVPPATAPAQSAWPVEAKTNTTNTYVAFTEDGGVAYTSADPEECGFVKLNNYENSEWEGDYEIALDRNEDFWIAGEFVPSFDYDTERSRPYCLLGMHYSGAIRWQPYPYANPGRQFQYAGYDACGDDPAQQYYALNINNFEFEAGDTVRYCYRHATKDYTYDPVTGRSLWVRNSIDPMNTYGSAHDPNGVDFSECAFRDVYVGSHQHGNMYQTGSNTRDSFYGTVTQTIIGTGEIPNDEAVAWLNGGRDSMPSGDVLFDLVELDREILIPLHPWQKDRVGDTLRIGEYGHAFWVGDHNILWVKNANGTSQYGCKASYDVGDQVAAEELERRYVTWATDILNEDCYHFYLKLWCEIEGEDGEWLYLHFSPSWTSFDSYCAGGVWYMEVPLDVSEPSWEMFQADMLDLARHPTYGWGESVTSVSVVRVVSRGQLRLGDMLLSNSENTGIETIDTGRWGLSAQAECDSVACGVMPSRGARRSLPGVSELKATGAVAGGSEASVSYDIAGGMGESQVELGVLDVSGRSVRRIYSGWRAPGSYRVVWDCTDGEGRKVPSGVYLVRLAAGRKVLTRRICIVR